MQLEARNCGLTPKEYIRRLAALKEQPRLASPGRWWKKDSGGKQDDEASWVSAWGGSPPHCEAHKGFIMEEMKWDSLKTKNSIKLPEVLGNP
jgi:hypothetical protein